MLWTAPVVGADPFKTLYVGEGEEYEPTTENEDDPVGPDSQPVMAEDEATEMEKKIWEAKLSRLHRAAGHPTSRNMARMLSDAQCPRWKVRMAMDFKCPICEESKPGGSSSKQIPPGSLRPLPSAWEHVGVDVGEWTLPGQDKKIKFLLMMDMATRFKVTEPLFVYKHGETKVESADDMIRVMTLRWLQDKPRPKAIIPDNAKSLTSRYFVEYMADVGIQVVPPPDNESWSHGMVENAIGHIKETCNRLQLSSPSQDPILTLGIWLLRQSMRRSLSKATAAFNGHMEGRRSWMRINYVNKSAFLLTVNNMNFFDYFGIVKKQKKLRGKAKRRWFWGS